MQKQNNQWLLIAVFLISIRVLIIFKHLKESIKQSLPAENPLHETATIVNSIPNKLHHLMLASFSPSRHLKHRLPQQVQLLYEFEYFEILVRHKVE